MPKPKSYWIKERHNPQFGTYYIVCGQMSKTAAMSMQRTLYGDNVMHDFDTKEAYEERIEILKRRGERVQ